MPGFEFWPIILPYLDKIAHTSESLNGSLTLWISRWKVLHFPPYLIALLTSFPKMYSTWGLSLKTPKEHGVFWFPVNSLNSLIKYWEFEIFALCTRTSARIGLNIFVGIWYDICFIFFVNKIPQTCKIEEKNQIPLHEPIMWLCKLYIYPILWM